MRRARNARGQFWMGEFHPCVSDRDGDVSPGGKWPGGADVQVHACAQTVSSAMLQLPLGNNKEKIRWLGRVRSVQINLPSQHRLTGQNFASPRQAMSLARRGDGIRRLENENIRADRARNF